MTTNISGVGAYNKIISMPVDKQQQAVPLQPAMQAAPFSDLVAHSLQKSIDTLHKSEKIAVESTYKQTSIHDLVNAVNQAELTMQTVVAIRDRVIQAYQDIIRMPV